MFLWDSLVLIKAAFKLTHPASDAISWISAFSQLALLLQNKPKVAQSWKQASCVAFLRCQQRKLRMLLIALSKAKLSTSIFCNKSQLTKWKLWRPSTKIPMCVQGLQATWHVCHFHQNILKVRQKCLFPAFNLNLQWFQSGFRGQNYYHQITKMRIGFSSKIHRSRCNSYSRCWCFAWYSSCIFNVCNLSYSRLRHRLVHFRLKCVHQSNLKLAHLRGAKWMQSFFPKLLILAWAFLILPSMELQPSKSLCLSCQTTLLPIELKFCSNEIWNLLHVCVRTEASYQQKLDGKDQLLPDGLLIKVAISSGLMELDNFWKEIQRWHFRCFNRPILCLTIWWNL